MKAYVEEKFTNLINGIYELIPLSDKPGRTVHLLPGNNVADDNCCDGQLTGRLVSLLPHVPNASGRSAGGGCGIDYWNGVGEVQLLRCAAVVNNQGKAPRPIVLDAEGVSQMDDSDAILTVLLEQDWVKSVNAWTPKGPGGGCRGIAITFGFRLDSPSRI